MNPQILAGDSTYYDILHRAAQSIKGVPGLTLEIGLRRGGGTETIIRGCLDNNDKRHHMAIDPYGMLPYAEGAKTVAHDYSNLMRQEALAAIYTWCKERQVAFTYWPMTDTDFFAFFPDGPPVYEGAPGRVTEFALVHFDGPHHTPAVLEEAAYFAKFAPMGAAWVFDDCNMYPHMDDCDATIWAHGFEIVEISEDVRRIWYRKVR